MRIPIKRKKPILNFVGQVSWWGKEYEAAALLSRTRQDKPYLSLRLTEKGDSQAEKINVALWQKKNRVTDQDPHFTTKETVDGDLYKFTARIDAGVIGFILALEVAPCGEGLEALSAEAQRAHQAISDFLQTSSITKSEPAQSKKTPPKKTLQFRDPDLEGEPNDLPW